MAETQAKSTTSRCLADLFTQGADWSLADQLQFVRDLAIQVHAAHEQGVVHRAIQADAVRVDERLHPQLDQPGPAVPLGGEGADLECCPPEMTAGEKVDVPQPIEAAAAALERGGHAIDPRRIDIYQLGTLACRLITGESVLGYLYDPQVKARVLHGNPQDTRLVLQRVKSLVVGDVQVT